MEKRPATTIGNRKRNEEGKVRTIFSEDIPPLPLQRIGLQRERTQRIGTVLLSTTRSGENRAFLREESTQKRTRHDLQTLPTLHLRLLQKTGQSGQQYP